MAESSGTSQPRIDRIERTVMTVNSFVVHAPGGLVLVDGQLTMSDAGLVRRAVADAGRPLDAVVITHPHPDHYAGLASIIGDLDIPILATADVDEIMMRDDAVKDQIVGPMMGAEWPTAPHLRQPDRRQRRHRHARRNPLPGRGHRPRRVPCRQPLAVGDGRRVRRRHRLQRPPRLPRRRKLAPVAESAGATRVRPRQCDRHPRRSRRVDNCSRVRPPAPLRRGIRRRHRANRDAIAAGDHTAVLSRMADLVANDALLFSMDLSIEPVAAALAADVA